MRKIPPFQVRTAGFINRERYHSTPGTKENDVMLTLFLDGRGFYRNSTENIAVAEGMVGLVPPEDSGVLMADPSDPYVHFFIRFGGSYAVSMARDILAEKKKRFFQVPNISQLAEWARSVGNIYRKDLPDYMGEPEVVLAKILVALSGKSEPDSKRELTQASIEQYFLERIADPVWLPAMADWFGISKSTLCRRVMRLTGKTAAKLAVDHKISWAKSLLQTGELNVEETALRVGFGDPFYFSRVFRQKVGVAPKQWSLQKKRKG